MQIVEEIILQILYSIYHDTKLIKRKYREENLLADTYIELESNDWIWYTIVKNPEFFVDKSQNYNKNY